MIVYRPTRPLCIQFVEKFKEEKIQASQRNTGGNTILPPLIPSIRQCCDFHGGGGISGYPQLVPPDAERRYIPRTAIRLIGVVFYMFISGRTQAFYGEELRLNATFRSVIDLLSKNARVYKYPYCHGFHRAFRHVVNNT